MTSKTDEILAHEIEIPATDSNQKALRTIFKGGAISLVGAILFIVINFVYQFALARILGPAQLGLLSLGTTIVGLVGLLVLFGLDSAVVRFVAGFMGVEDRQCETGAILSSISLLLLTSMLVIPFTFAISGILAVNVFHKPDLTPVLRLLTLGIPFLAGVSLFVAIAQAYKRVEFKAGIEQTLIPLLNLGGFLLAAAIIGRTTMAAASVILVSAILAFLLSALLVRTLYLARRSDAKPILVYGQLLRFSLPFMFLAILNRTHVQAETLVLGSLAPAEEVGVYTVGLRITTLIILPLTSLNVIFAPIIAELYTKNDMKGLSFQFKTVTRWAFSLALPLALAMIVVSPEIISIFGAGFEQSVTVVRILALAQLIFVLTGPVGYMLSMTNYPGINLVNSALTIVVSLILAFILVPRYGAAGAAVSAGISIGFINLLRLIEVYVLLRLQPYDWSFWKPVAAGVAATFVAIGASWLLVGSHYIVRLAGLSLVLGVIYLLVIFALGLSAEDRQLGTDILQRIRRD